MNPPVLKKLYKTTVAVAWALLFVALPVTSFPFFPGGLGGKTLVRPLAVYPLIILVVLITIPRLFSRPLPRTFLPLFAFIIVAFISSIAAFSLDIEALRGVSIESRFLRNIITLGIGSAFYLTISLLHQTREDLNFSLRWLYTGFTIALIWGTLQALYVIYFSPQYFDLISELQSLISTRRLFPTRISGMTYEPKWFAEQISFLLLPWLLGSIITKRSVFQWRFKWLTVEWILLAWSVVIVAFTFSRTGLFMLAALSFLAFLLYRSHSGDRSGSSSGRPAKKRGRRFLEAALITLAVLIFTITIGAQNRYISRFWRYWTDDRPARKTYLEYIGFQQRFVYWQTALRTFEEFPVLGVGLGNYAYYFDEMLPNQTYNRQPEIVRQITPVEGRNRLITPKNLYARLLAETGLIGTVIFTTFIIAVLGCALFLWYSESPEQRFWGLSGILGLFVFLFVIFSYDSFALPNMWVIFGITTAAAHLSEPAQLKSIEPAVQTR